MSTVKCLPLAFCLYARLVFWMNSEYNVCYQILFEAAKKCLHMFNVPDSLSYFMHRNAFQPFLPTIMFFLRHSRLCCCFMYYPCLCIICLAHEGTHIYPQRPNGFYLFVRMLRYAYFPDKNSYTLLRYKNMRHYIYFTSKGNNYVIIQDS